MRLKPDEPAHRTNQRLALRVLIIGLAGAALVAVGFVGSRAVDDGSTAVPEELLVRQVTIDEPINGRTAAVRLVIDNQGGPDDELVAVRTDAAGSATIHRSGTDDAGRSTMAELPELAVPAGETVVFRPGGLHIMLGQFRRPMAVGDTIELTLTFAHAGTRTITAEVVPIGAFGDEAAEGHHH